MEGNARTQSTKDAEKCQDQIKTVRQSTQSISLNRSARPRQRRAHATFLATSSSNKSSKAGLQKQDGCPSRVTLKRTAHESDLKLGSAEVPRLPSQAFLGANGGSSFSVNGE